MKRRGIVRAELLVVGALSLFFSFLFFVRGFSLRRVCEFGGYCRGSWFVCDRLSFYLVVLTFLVSLCSFIVKP